jgi:predicted NBD/HSP70 family sugar kinase
LGGTKIVSTVFDSDMVALSSRRRATPRGSYAELLAAVADEISWLRDSAAQHDLPVGIGIPGLVDPRSSVSICANLAANGHRLAPDLAARAGGRIVSANDCKCFALSEAHGGAGQGFARVFGLILGTGLGGGVCQEGMLELGLNGLPGEVGHYSLPAHLVVAHRLPLVACGCGRIGCTETLISGTGMARLAQSVLGVDRAAPEIASAPDDPGNARVLTIWAELTAELIHTIQLHIDPDCIVLGGGLSNIAGLEVRLATALDRIALPSLRRPIILKPAFGDSSGARGAALLALQTPERA